MSLNLERIPIATAFSSALWDKNLKMPEVTDLNAFACCRFLKHLGKVMVLIVLALSALACYAVLSAAIVPGLQSSNITSQTLFALLLVLYIVLVSLMLWSYFATLLADPGLVPVGWHPFQNIDNAEAELNAIEQYIYEIDNNQGSAYVERPRFCRKCQRWKPPRAHHCSVTGACVLKMDHYCIWVLNCVGLLNYKYFLLFIFYGFLSCLASAALLIVPCLDFFRAVHPPGGAIIVAFLAFVFCAAFTLALLGFLILHIKLVVTNHTTIEAYEKAKIRPWPHDKGGALRNVEYVLGRKYWLLPMYSVEDKRALIRDFLDFKYQNLNDLAV
jgi:palmitoyltransferase ZDHHC2/15/20